MVLVHAGAFKKYTSNICLVPTTATLKPETPPCIMDNERSQLRIWEIQSLRRLLYKFSVQYLALGTTIMVFRSDSARIESLSAPSALPTSCSLMGHYWDNFHLHLKGGRDVMKYYITAKEHLTSMLCVEET
jgi:hypothetical protein